MLILLGLALLEGRKHSEKADHHQSGSLTMLRVMVIGSNVTTVQRISRYCLEHGADVFPTTAFRGLRRWLYLTRRFGILPTCA
jgi:hypothetical protein